ncbi:MAG: ABC transporter substrate-binding protein [bacterium]|nr:ABC transporter substrate-binding protein [bacterium]
MRDDSRGFSGPVGEFVEPSSLEAISIGLFAPVQSDDAAAGALYRGALLAIRQANAKGGYRGVNFRLVRRWAGEPWGAGSKEMIRLAYEDRVWGVIGFSGGAGHIALQVAAKAHIPVVAPVSTSTSLTATGVPWIFRLPPGDKLQAQLLLKGITGNQLNTPSSLKRVGLVSGSNHSSRAAGKAVEKEINRQEVPLLFHFKMEQLSGCEEIVRRIRLFETDVLILCLRPPFITRLLKGMQRAGMTCPLGIPWTPGVDIAVLKTSYGAHIFSVEPFGKGDGYLAFSRGFEKRFGEAPSFSAAYGYDAASIIIHSIRTKGLNRTAIRAGLEELSGYKGACGPIKWNNGGGNHANPILN